jgi:hypothetical protein
MNMMILPAKNDASAAPNLNLTSKYYNLKTKWQISPTKTAI